MKREGEERVCQIPTVDGPVGGEGVNLTRGLGRLYTGHGPCKVPLTGAPYDHWRHNGLEKGFL